MRRPGRLAATLAATVLLATGCGSDPSAAPTTALSVTGTDELKFDPDEFAVPAGETVTLTFAAQSAVEHDFVVEGAGEHGMVGDAG